MSKQHLAKGSMCPSKVEGKLRLYSMEFCPFAERARLVLLVKNVPHDIVNVNINNKPDWLFQLNPEGKVPVLDASSQPMAESLDICDFLNDQYPDPPLYPTDKEASAKEKAFIKSFDILISLFYQAIVESKQPYAECMESMLPHVRRFEGELKKRGTYFGGDKPNMTDYMLWPWGERAFLVGFVYGEEIPGSNEFPCLYAWCKAMRTCEAVKETVTSAERLKAFINLYRKRSVSADYDSI